VLLFLEKNGCQKVPFTKTLNYDTWEVPFIRM
jgi:hypothetical protein